MSAKTWSDVPGLVLEDVWGTLTAHGYTTLITALVDWVFFTSWLCAYVAMYAAVRATVRAIRRHLVDRRSAILQALIYEPKGRHSWSSPVHTGDGADDTHALGLPLSAVDRPFTRVKYPEPPEKRAERDENGW